MPAHVRLMVYGKDHLEEFEDIPLQDAIERAKGPGVGWLALYEPDEAAYDTLGEGLGLHPLALEDCRNQRQRAKAEDFGDHTYIVARPVERRDHETRSFQSNIFFGAGWVVVVHERPHGLFDDVRHRIRRGRPRIRSSGADYLVYALLDACVDTYFPPLESIGERIEEMEDEMQRHLNDEHLDAIHALKRDLRRLRRTAWPARDAIGQLLRDEAAGFKKSNLPFLRDVHDHTIQAIDLIENHREATTSLTDLYMTLVSNRMNEIMKVLTIVATMFIPITFLAGLYGMNFDPDAGVTSMPELGWEYGYVTFLGVVVLVVLLELWFFRRKRWI